MSVMLDKGRILRGAAVGMIALASVVPSCHSARAQDDARSKTGVSRARPASPNATINLVNLLVKQNILTEEQAADLIKQAEDEAYVAREAAKDVSAKAAQADKTAAAAAAQVSPPGAKRVTYVPEVVKRELREQVRKEVMDQAKAENWAAPNTFPEWTSRIRFYGDVRMRYEKRMYPAGNDTGGSLYNFNAINTGNPIDVDFNDGSGQATFPPVRDADQRRQRFLLRARLGMEADLFDGFTAGMRIATGDNNSPVSTNATLGGGGGNFSKYPLWLDRAWLRYDAWDSLTMSAGRFNNPFFSPTDLVWYDELGFDGVAIQAKREIAPGFTPFAVAGAFPLYNTLLNYPNTGTTTNSNGAAIGSNLPSSDKYLFGFQGGARWQIDPEVSFQFGAAYYDFYNVRGRLSDACNVTTVNDTCNTDALRPSFAQFGNTYMALRDIIPVTNGPQFQYYGLASAFRVLDITARLDLAHFNPVHVILDGTYVQNLAFNRGALSQIAVNNLGASPNAAASIAGPYEGRNVGAMGRVTVGYPQINKLWDWNVWIAYKYLQSDAVIDAYTDPDFGLGGTNLKGYIVGANLGVGPNTWLRVKWMSANSIAGAPFAVDVLQLDLNGKF